VEKLRTNECGDSSKWFATKSWDDRFRGSEGDFNVELSAQAAGAASSGGHDLK